MSVLGGTMTRAWVVSSALIALIGCLVAWPRETLADTFADELGQRQQFTYSGMLAAGAEQFDRENEVANALREHYAEFKTSSGAWRLTSYYEGIRREADYPDEDRLFPDMKGATARWFAQFPASPPGYIAHAIVLIEEAFRLRGQGEPYVNAMAAARTFLEHNKAVAGADPYWYVLMTEIAERQYWDWDQYRPVVQEGIKRFPEYYELYQKATEHLLLYTRLGKDGLEPFARWAAKHAGPDRGAAVYARIYQFASEIQFGAKLREQTDVDWSRMRKGIKQIMAQYPAGWHQAKFGLLACLSSDKETTAMLLDSFADTHELPPPQVWMSEAHFEACRQWAHSGSSPAPALDAVVRTSYIPVQFDRVVSARERLTAAYERGMRNEIGDLIEATLQGNNHEALEALIRQLRVSKARLPSGGWKLDTAYDRVENLLSQAHSAPQSDPWREFLFRFIADHIEKYPQSPTSQILQATLLSTEAWAARGKGYAASVTPEAWAKFYDAIDRELKYFEAHKSIARQDPRYYALMVIAASDAQWDATAIDGIVEQAAAAEPNYERVYFARANYLTPKWGVEPQTLDAFARKAAELTSTTEDDGMYARIYSVLNVKSYRWKAFSQLQPDWPFLWKAMQNYMARHPGGYTANRFAMLACEAGQKEATAVMLRKLDENDDSYMPDEWPNQESFESCRSWAYDNGIIGPQPQENPKTAPIAPN